MHCTSCEKEIDILEALENSQFSWPEMQTIWYVCNKCKTGNHIRFSDGKAEQIKITGAPGPEYDIVREEIMPTLKIRVDPEFLHVWLQDKHYEFKAW